MSSRLRWRSGVKDEERVRAEGAAEFLGGNGGRSVGRANYDGGQNGPDRSSHPDGDAPAEVNRVLLDSPELAIKKNSALFERKSKMQRRELAEMWRIVHHEGDRIIEAGPALHDGTIDVVRTYQILIVHDPAY